MKVLQGKYECKCGKMFDWKTFALEDGEIIAYRPNLVESNAHKINQDEQYYHIEVVCPHCEATEIVLIPRQ